MYQTYTFLRVIILAVILIHGSGVVIPVFANDQLSSDPAVQSREPFFTNRMKQSSIGAALSLGLSLAVVGAVDEVNRNPLIRTPPGVDRSLRERLRDDDGMKTNFLNRHGSLYTIGGGVAAMSVLQHLLAENTVWRDTAQELTIFGIGLMTEVGVRMTVKSSFARRRPLLEFADPASQAALNTKPNNHQSFYSGHASTAFYTAAYVDQKIGDLLRSRVQSRKALLYRSLSVISLYGWASYNAYSRIEIDKHYFTDVFTGGAIGTAWAIWHYRYHHGNRKSWSVMPAYDGERIGMMISRVY